MSAAVYLLCAVTSLVCAALLIRRYRTSRAKLLFWAALCFVGLAISNLLVFVDLIVIPTVDLFYWRTTAALTGMIVLLFGLVWESR